MSYLDLLYPQDDYMKVLKEVENSRQRLSYSGFTQEAQRPEKHSALTKFFNIISRPGYAVFNAAREFTDPNSGMTPGKFDPLQAAVRGLTDKERTSGKDFMKTLGLSTDPMFQLGKFKAPSAAGVAGFVAEVLNPLDPINWLTFGLGNVVKGAGLEGASMLHKAYGADLAEDIASKIKPDILENVTGKNMGQLQLKLVEALQKSKVEQSVVDDITKKIENFYGATGSTTKTKLPGVSTSRRISMNLAPPLSRKNIVSFDLPGTEKITAKASEAGQKVKALPIVDPIIRNFTKLAPGSLSNTRVLERVFGSKEATDIAPIYQKEAGDQWNALQDMFRQRDITQNTRVEQFQNEAKQYLEQIPEDTRKALILVAGGKQVPGLNLDPSTAEGLLNTQAVEYFRQWMQDIPKMYQRLKDIIGEDMFNRMFKIDPNNPNVPNNYVPFIPKGGARLTPEETQLLELVSGGRQVEDAVKQNMTTDALENLSFYTGLDKNLMERTVTKGYTVPQEVNTIIDKPWLEEDMAKILDTRVTRAIKTEEASKLSADILGRWGMTHKELMQNGGIPSNYAAIKLTGYPNGAIKFSAIDDKELAKKLSESGQAWYLPKDFVESYNKYIDLHFNPMNQNRLFKMFVQVPNHFFRMFAYMATPGHIPRDFLSNITNAWIGGVDSVKPYTEAVRLLERDGLSIKGNANETYTIPIKAITQPGDILLPFDKNTFDPETMVLYYRNKGKVKEARGEGKVFDILNNTNAYNEIYMLPKSIKESIASGADEVELTGDHIFSMLKRWGVLDTGVLGNEVKAGTSFTDNIKKGFSTTKTTLQYRTPEDVVDEPAVRMLDDVAPEVDAPAGVRQGDKIPTDTPMDIRKQPPVLDVPGERRYGTPDLVTREVMKSPLEITKDALSSTVGSGWNWYMDKMMKGTRTIDNYSRFAAFLGFLQNGQSLDEAMASVKKYLFDYNDLTTFEKQVMRNVFPFYTWLRKNLPLQVHNALTQPRKYNTFANIHEAANQDTEQDMPNFFTEVGGIKLPFDGMYANMNLPYQDLARIPLDDRGFSEFMSQLTPLIKAPAEYALNKEFFSGLPIEHYDGQTEPFMLSQPIVQLLNALGADVEAPLVERRNPVNLALKQLPFLRSLNIISSGAGSDDDLEQQKSLSRLISFLGGPQVYYGDRLERSATYEERQRLRDIIRKLEDEGTEIPSIRELQRMGF